MSKRFKFAGETCAYCAERPAMTADHIFARSFFVVPRRGNLPQVPACDPCNSEKARLEHYLTAVLPFGGLHVDGPQTLAELVPRRLANNLALHRELAAGISRVLVDEGGTPVQAMTVPFEPEKLSALFTFIAKGLAWHHWGVLVDQGADVWAGILNATGENIFNSWLARNGRARTTENLGDDTFAYVGVQGMDNPQMSVWVFAIYGGLRLSGDPDAPHEQVSKVGVLIASKELIERFNAMLAGGSPSWFRRAWVALRRILVQPLAALRRFIPRIPFRGA
jgi:hypothetical protein